MIHWTNHLPATQSSLIGRRHETAEAQQLLLTHRQLTLTGPAGCGKTRLAISIAERLRASFAQRVFFVELAPVKHPALVPRVVAANLGVSDNSLDDIRGTLAAVLATQRTLLVLDNCEHLIAACAALVSLLRDACPQLYVLLTSREALRFADECEQMIPDLPYPPAPAVAGATLSSAELLQCESVQLFVDRAWGSNPAFAVDPPKLQAIGQICRQLEGLPLAIELAAANAGAFAIEHVAGQLGSGLDLLRAEPRMATSHHQSLVAALDWSYQLLDDRARACFRQMAVFAGGWSCAAAAAVYGDTMPATEQLLAILAQKSLIVVKPQSGEPRYRMLEPVRQYALMLLEQHDELDQARDRHLAYFAQFVRRVEPGLISADQQVWSELVERELANLRVAMDWSLAVAAANPGGQQAIVALSMPARLERFWVPRGHCGEGDERLGRALALPGAARPAAGLARAAALNARAVLRCYLGLDDATYSGLAQALAIARQAGDQLLELVTLRNLGTVAVLRGAHAEGETWLEHGLNVAAGLGSEADHSIAWSRLLLGSAAYLKGDYAGAAANFTAAIERLRVQGDLTMLGLTLRRLGAVALQQGRYQRASALLCESLTHNITLRSPSGIAASAATLAGVLLGQSRTTEAAQLLAAAGAVQAAMTDRLISIDQTIFDNHVRAAREQLGALVFEEIWTLGTATAAEQAIASIAELAAALSPAAAPADEEQIASRSTVLLTPRERQVATLVAQGRSNREIAYTLRIEVKTVEAHITRIMGKLDVNSRVQIATWIFQQGLVTPQ